MVGIERGYVKKDDIQRTDVKEDERKASATKAGGFKTRKEKVIKASVGDAQRKRW